MGLANDNTYGSKGSNFNYQLRMLKLFGSSSLIAGNIQTLVTPTYSYSGSQTFVANMVTSLTDVFAMQTTNVARTVRLRKISIGMTSDIATVLNVSLVKRSTLDTVSYSPVLQISKVAHDTANPSPYMKTQCYEHDLNGIGTFVGEMKRDVYLTAVTGTTPPRLNHIFGDNGEQLPEIQNALEGYYISLNGHAPVTNLRVFINLEWDELPA